MITGYADDVHLLDKNINIIKKSTKPSKEVGQVVNADRLSICLWLINRMAENNLMIINTSLKNVAIIKYLGMMLTNKFAFMKKLRYR